MEKLMQHVNAGAANAPLEITQEQARIRLPDGSTHSAEIHTKTVAVQIKRENGR